MEHPATYKKRNVVVLGLAKSGLSVAKVFHRLGAEVIVNDKKERELCPEADQLTALGISVLCGYHPEDLINEHTALLIKNPGIPYSAPPVQQALNKGVEVITEVEAAYWLSPAPMIGITGSNGKTTTTTLVGELLQSVGLKPVVAGNIGRPLCEAAEEAAADEWIVAELSSFQLKGTSSFRPRIALLLNIAETHLDYHGSMDDYIASKAKIFANQTAEDVAILNWDDKICREIASGLQSKLLPFSLYEQLETGVFLDPPYGMESDRLTASRDSSKSATYSEPERYIVYRGDTESGRVEVRIMPVDEIGIPGRHNAANALAAIAACIAAGAAPERLAEPLRRFKAVEHRLEHVCDVNGVSYYNDSKATNPQATIMALRSLKQPIVLVAGGLDRGSDYAELLPIFGERLKAIVTIGETREKLASVARQAGLAKVEVVEPEKDAEFVLQQAVLQASALAEPGDIVLLSPACASWDMFASYEQRGSIFKKSAHTL